MKSDIVDLLRGNPYPGRGLMIGHSGDGARVVVFYFIMGRSFNSRNRVFERTADGIRTKAHDLAKMTDPSLVIYNPVRIISGRTIVTNGDQTDTIYEFIQNGRDYRDALITREYEPDEPNFTPRISGLIEPDGSYNLSILKTTDGNPGSCLRCFFEYSKGIPGLGHYLSTYETDGDPLPSFCGEPVPVGFSVADGIGVFAETVWDAMSIDNKVSLYAREIIIATGESSDVIINKNV